MWGRLHHLMCHTKLSIWAWCEGLRGRWRSVMNTVSSDSSDLFVSSFIPLWDCFLLPLSTSASHNYPLTVFIFLPRSLTYPISPCLYLTLLFSCKDPPPTPLCRIITMSPRGPTSAPYTFSTREAVEEAITASSQRRWCSQTGLELSTSTSTSPTGSQRTARALQFQLILGTHATDDESMVDSFQGVDSFSLP